MMKTYTAQLVTRQYQTVTVTVPDDYTEDQIHAALCRNGNPSDGEFESELYDIEMIEDNVQEIA
jgi:hypothetical protein